MAGRTIAVVGHGPSLAGRQLGSEIDRADLVVRMKWHRDLTSRPEIFGSRTDIAASSFTVAKRLPELWPDVTQFIVAHDSRTYSVSAEQENAVLAIFQKNKAFSLWMDKALCLFWDGIYRGLASRDDEPHTSSGFHVLMFLGKYFPSSKVRLYGFDSMLSGNWTWSLTRGPDWEKYPKHRFDIEKQMLGMLRAAYDIEFSAGGCRI